MTREADIRRILAEGKRVRARYLEIRTLASPLDHMRVGFVVPKYGRSAVERNRLKRRLREIVRTAVLETRPPLDAVVRVWPAAYTVQFSALRDDLLSAVTRLADSSR